MKPRLTLLLDRIGIRKDSAGAWGLSIGDRFRSSRFSVSRCKSGERHWGWPFRSGRGEQAVTTLTLAGWHFRKTVQTDKIGKHIKDMGFMVLLALLLTGCAPEAKIEDCILRADSLVVDLREVIGFNFDANGLDFIAIAPSGLKVRIRSQDHDKIERAWQKCRAET